MEPGTVVESFWTMRLADVINALILVATIVAIVYGPIKAVEISRDNDLIREARRRKREIIAALMRTRNTTMNPDHVAALNLIQLEFQEYPTVLSTFRLYIENLSDPIPPPGNSLDNFLQKRRNLFFDLLHAMGGVINYSVERSDLERLAYVPLGWANEEQEHRMVRLALIEILQGRKALPVVEMKTSQAPQSPFPPPPAQQ